MYYCSYHFISILLFRHLSHIRQISIMLWTAQFFQPNLLPNTFNVNINHNLCKAAELTLIICSVLHSTASCGAAEMTHPCYLCFSSERCHIADLLRPQRVDDWALSHIRVANETHAYLFLVCVELWEMKKYKVKSVVFRKQQSQPVFGSLR